MPGLLLVPDYDLATRSASGFILRWISPRMAPIQLYSILDRRLPFRLSAPQSDIIIGVGHGGPDVLAGQNSGVILKVGQYNPKEIEGKVIKLLACQTGVTLGPDLIDNGAECYMGYVDDYVWIVDEDVIGTPWNDALAIPCLEPVVDGINALLDGQTAEEAFNLELKGYSEYAQVEENLLIRACINFNMKNAVLLGNKEAVVKQRPSIVFPIGPPPFPKFF